MLALTPLGRIFWSMEGIVSGSWRHILESNWGQEPIHPAVMLTELEGHRGYRVSSQR